MADSPPGQRRRLRRAWQLFTNRVILGMVLFLALMGVWEFSAKPRLFPQALVEDRGR